MNEWKNGCKKIISLTPLIFHCGMGSFPTTACHYFVWVVTTFSVAARVKLFTFLSLQAEFQTIIVFTWEIVQRWCQNSLFQILIKQMKKKNSARKNKNDEDAYISFIDTIS